MVKFAGLVAILLVPTLSLAAEEAAGNGAAAPLDYQSWHAHNDVGNLSSLQRGARNFMNYCVGCHSLKYLRYSRLGTDLKIPDKELQEYLLGPGDTVGDYITTSLKPADGIAWFGKAPPDLSLIVRAREGSDYVYKFLKTFYIDTSRPTFTNNLMLPNAAMPAVTSSLQGVQQAVFKDAVVDGANTKVFDHFVLTSPGEMSPEEYDNFVRDTVNFLDYASEPAQVSRRDIGVWAVLFMLALTWMAWLLKKEYWKDVH
jgi:ubiquinol-cytochrome c reductase cytochrome c1 subunit